MAWCLVKQWIRLHGVVLSQAQEQIYVNYFTDMVISF